MDSVPATSPDAAPGGPAAAETGSERFTARLGRRATPVVRTPLAASRPRTPGRLAGTIGSFGHRLGLSQTARWTLDAVDTDGSDTTHVRPPINYWPWDDEAPAEPSAASTPSTPTPAASTPDDDFVPSGDDRVDALRRLLTKPKPKAKPKAAPAGTATSRPAAVPRPVRRGLPQVLHRKGTIARRPRPGDIARRLEPNAVDPRSVPARPASGSLPANLPAAAAQSRSAFGQRRTESRAEPTRVAERAAPAAPAADRGRSFATAPVLPPWLANDATTSSRPTSDAATTTTSPRAESPTAGPAPAVNRAPADPRLDSTATARPSSPAPAGPGDVARRGPVDLAERARREQAVTPADPSGAPDGRRRAATPATPVTRASVHPGTPATPPTPGVGRPAEAKSPGTAAPGATPADPPASVAGAGAGAGPATVAPPAAPMGQPVGVATTQPAGPSEPTRAPRPTSAPSGATDTAPARPADRVDPRPAADRTGTPRATPSRADDAASGTVRRSPASTDTGPSGLPAETARPPATSAAVPASDAVTRSADVDPAWSPLAAAPPGADPARGASSGLGTGARAPGSLLAEGAPRPPVASATSSAATTGVEPHADGPSVALGAPGPPRGPATQPTRREPATRPTVGTSEAPDAVVRRLDDRRARDQGTTSSRPGSIAEPASRARPDVGTPGSARVRTADLTAPGGAARTRLPGADPNPWPTPPDAAVGAAQVELEARTRPPTGEAAPSVTAAVVRRAPDPDTGNTLTPAPPLTARLTAVDDDHSAAGTTRRAPVATDTPVAPRYRPNWQGDADGTTRPAPRPSAPDVPAAGIPAATIRDRDAGGPTPRAPGDAATTVRRSPADGYRGQPAPTSRVADGQGAPNSRVADGQGAPNSRAADVPAARVADAPVRPTMAPSPTAPGELAGTPPASTAPTAPTARDVVRRTPATADTARPTTAGTDADARTADRGPATPRRDAAALERDARSARLVSRRHDPMAPAASAPSAPTTPPPWAPTRSPEWSPRPAAGDTRAAAAGALPSALRPAPPTARFAGLEADVAAADVAVAAAPEHRFESILRRTPAAPAPLPVQWRPLASAIAGERRVRVSTNPASRAALRAAGKRAATTGDVIHLAQPLGSVADAPLLAHELTHVANPSPAPRFFDDDRDSPEERRAAMIADVIRRSPVLPSSAAAATAPRMPAAPRLARPASTPSTARVARTTSSSGPSTTADDLVQRIASGGGRPSGGSGSATVRRTPDTIQRGPTLASHRRSSITPPVEHDNLPSFDGPAPSPPVDSSTPPSLTEDATASLANSVRTWPVMTHGTDSSTLRDLTDWIVEQVEARVMRELERRGGRYRGEF